jgi:hypothetical protein
MCTTVIVDPMGIELSTIRDVASFLGISPAEVDSEPESSWHGHSSYDFCLCGVNVEPLFVARGYAYTGVSEADPFSDHVIKTGPPQI